MVRQAHRGFTTGHGRPASQNPEGLTQSQIFTGVFQGHKKSPEIQRALQTLLDSGKIEVIEAKTSGRAKKIYKVKFA
jgi:hypothetical protein